jgi:tetratricopeptide (TPR) repeat protein
MADDVKSMTAELVRDPSSIVFLRLGEVLRADGQVEAARKVALTGLERHPDLVEAHDLYARILVDANEVDHAQRVWGSMLQIDPRHQGAHMGLGFLHYSRGDLDVALDHLELALAADPTNQSVVQALHAVRNVAESVAAEEPEDAFAGFEGQDRGILLADSQGRALTGRVVDNGGRDSTEEVAAHLAGVTQEMERTARMLKLGEWQWLLVEATNGNAHLTPPDPDSLLWFVRDRDMPAGRLALFADRAGAAARTWLETQRL